MLGRMRNKKRIDCHELQAIHNVVKKGGDTVFEDFEEKFQEVVVDGKRMKTSVFNYAGSSSSKKDYTLYGNSKLSMEKVSKKSIPLFYIFEVKKV